MTLEVMRSRSATGDLNEEPNDHEAIERHFVYVFQIFRLRTPHGLQQWCSDSFFTFFSRIYADSIFSKGSARDVECWFGGGGFGC